MRNLKLRIPAIVGLIFNGLSFAFMISSLAAMLTETNADYVSGVAPSFALWVYGAITAIFGIIFYLPDAFFSVANAVKAIHPIFNVIRTLLILGAYPMMLFIGARPAFYAYVWNAYYLVLFIFEIISLWQEINYKNYPKL